MYLKCQEQNVSFFSRIFLVTLKKKQQHQHFIVIADALITDAVRIFML